MADKDDSDFEVFLTISEYRKYQNMQKQLDEEKELHRKEKAAIEEKMRSAEKVSENFKRELSERNQAINQISVECLRVKQELKLCKDKVVSQEVVWEKSKVKQLEQLEQSSTDKISFERKLNEAQLQLESLKAENASLVEAMDRSNASYKGMQAEAQRLRNDLSDREAKQNSVLSMLKQQAAELTRIKQQLAEKSTAFEKLEERFRAESYEKSRIDDLTSSLSAEKAQLASSMSSIAKELESSKKQLEKVQRQRDDAVFSKREQEEVNHILESQKSSLQTEVERLSVKLKQSRSTATENETTLKQRVSELSGTIKSLQDKLQEKEEQVSLAKEKAQEYCLKPQQEVLQTEGSNKYSAAIVKILENHRQNCNYDELRDQINALIVLENEYQSIIDADRRKVSDLESQISQLQNQLEVVQKRLRASIEREEAQQVQLRKMNQRMLDSSRLLDEVMKEKNDGKKDTELLLARQEVERLTKQLRAVQSSLSTLERFYNQEVSKFKPEKHNNPKEYLHNYFEELRQSLAALEKEESNQFQICEIDNLIQQLEGYRPKGPPSYHNPHLGMMR